MIQLISHEAQLMASAEAAMKQARNASDTASRLMDDQDDKQTSKHIEQLKAGVCVRARTFMRVCMQN
jgi:hypothetical protein